MEEKDEIEFYDNIDVAMDNSYKVLTGVETFESIMAKDKGVWLLFDPHDPDKNKDNVLEVMLMYFEDNEEYERCSVIKGMIEE